MTHKTLIGGTAYEIGGGKTLVNGTAYSIDKGKTLVGGTVYEVGFAEMATITLDFSSAAMAGHLSVKVNGTEYSGGYGGGHNGKVYEISVPVGDEIVCTLNSGVYLCKIVINGATVVSTKDGATYEYTVIGNATIIFNSTTLTITET